MEPESESNENCCNTIIELSEQGDISDENNLHKITTTEDMTNTSPPVKHKMVKTDTIDEMVSESEVLSDEANSNSNETKPGEEKRSTLKRILRRRSNTCSQLNNWMANVLPKKKN